MFNVMVSPKVDLARFSGKTAEIVSQVFKSDGSLYRTKPKNATGEAKYVWRMLAYYISTNRQHQCMPTTADFDLEALDENGKWSARVAQAQSKELDVFVENILKTIPSDKLPGILRWRKAFGK